MKKPIKFCSLIFLTIFCSCILIVSCPKAISDVNLVQDSAKVNKLSSHFRKSTDKITPNKNQELNLQGLDKLNISGSNQFTESGLSLIKESIPNNFSITDIDLRQESHGFINGIAVSWKNSKNNANMGLSKDEVIRDENEK